MIHLKLPVTGARNYTRWQIYGRFNYSPTDPNLTDKRYMYNYYLYEGFGNNSGASWTPNFVVNVPNAISRDNFRTQLAGLLTTLSSVLGNLTVLNNAELFYGTDPITPALLLWEFKLDGSCNLPLPNPQFVLTEFQFTPGFTYEVTISNNTCGLILE